MLWPRYLSIEAVEGQVIEVPVRTCRPAASGTAAQCEVRGRSGVVGRDSAQFCTWELWLPADSIPSSGTSTSDSWRPASQRKWPSPPACSSCSLYSTLCSSDALPGVLSVPEPWHLSVATLEIQYGCLTATRQILAGCLCVQSHIIGYVERDTINSRSETSMTTADEPQEGHLEAQAEETEPKGKGKGKGCATVGCLVILGIVAIAFVIGLISSALDDSDNCSDQFTDDVFSEGRAALNFPDTFNFESTTIINDNEDGTATYGIAFSGTNAFGVRTTLRATAIYETSDCSPVSRVFISQ